MSLDSGIKYGSLIIFLISISSLSFNGLRISLTNSTNEAKIDLRFADSYKLEEIDYIMYSVYDTEGYSSTKTVEFIPQVIMSGEERYYMFTLDEVISREGKYYIEIQFFKQDETEGNIMIDATSIEYVYLRGN